jgi:hypothetical protein
MWRRPWSDALQAKWLEAVTDIALSKPFVEAVCWQDLVDMPAKSLAQAQSVPFGGLTNTDLSPKPALRTWASLRRAVMNFRQPGNPGTPPPPPANPEAPPEPPRTT